MDGYCLTGDHVHVIGTPRREESPAKAVGRTHSRCTQYVNRSHSRSGRLWQNRFFRCRLDEEHYWNAMVYMERNPVRARRVRAPWRHRWCSAAAHYGTGADETGLPDLAFLAVRPWGDATRRPPGALSRQALVP